ncbi:unnamed protein product [Rotaria sordida]|nr:unnamed protein product [Rotaria sordida]CAF1431587.1 unnamed protein product [Rotaria sordida]CAF4012194.1 unnamed protein product [Rotaria sordida]
MNKNQTLALFTSNQLDNIKTVSSTDDTFFAKNLTTEKLLKQTGTNADHILKREEMWNFWKNNACTDFSKSKIDLKKKTSLQYRLSDNIR